MTLEESREIIPLMESMIGQIEEQQTLMAEMLSLIHISQLGRSFEFALPKEWSRQEQIQYTADYIKKTFVDKGMCADWSIHDKGDGLSLIHI